MDKTLRSILWVLVILVLVSSFSAGWFFWAREGLYNDYVHLENIFKNTAAKLNEEIRFAAKENTELTAKFKAMKKELALLEAKNKEVESQCGALLNEKDDLTKELSRVKKGKFFVEKRLKEIESDTFVANLLKEKAALEVELKKEQAILASKDVDIEKLNRGNIGLDVNFAKLEEEKAALEEKLKNSIEIAEILTRENKMMKARVSEGEMFINRFNSLIVEKESMQLKIFSMEKELAGRNSELDRLNIALREKDDVLEKLKESAGKIDKLLTERENMRVKVSGLERELDSKKEDIERLTLALKSGARDSKKLRAEAYQVPNEVNLPPIVLESRINTYSSLQGRVVALNTDYNFVVIDLGIQDGIEKGVCFDVYRDNSLVGSLEVIQARERIAACDIKDAEEGVSIQVNDVVVGTGRDLSDTSTK